MLTRKKVGLSAAALFLSVSLSACAGPPLQLYTLGGAATPAGQAQGLVAPGTPVLEIRRVLLPDYLDTQDIVVRNGQSLDRSPNGRWAERLSDGITDFIVARVGSARPDIFVTGQSLTGPATARLAISITRLDVAASGTAILEASWAVLPADEHQPEGQLQRGTISVSGPSKTDANVVTLTNTLIRQLSDRITQSLPARL